MDGFVKSSYKKLSDMRCWNVWVARGNPLKPDQCRVLASITCVTLFQIIYPAAMATAATGASNAALWGDFYNM